MTRMRILAGFLLLAAGCGSLRTGNNPAEFTTVENLSPEVFKSFWESDRQYVQSVLGKPQRAYPSDGGEAYEYRSEHMQLKLIFYDKGVVETMSYTTNPEYEAEMHRLYQEHLKVQQSPQIDK